MNDSPKEQDEQVKPPLGIETEWIWKQRRCFELVRVIARYDAAERCCEESWFLELGKLIPDVFPERARKPSSCLLYTSDAADE